MVQDFSHQQYFGRFILLPQHELIYHNGSPTTILICWYTTHHFLNKGLKRNRYLVNGDKDFLARGVATLDLVAISQLFLKNKCHLPSQANGKLGKFDGERKYVCNPTRHGETCSKGNTFDIFLRIITMNQ